MGLGIDLDVFLAEALEAFEKFLDCSSIDRDISSFKETEEFILFIPERSIRRTFRKGEARIAKILVDEEKPFSMIEEGS
jgi:hypothetical protein